MNGFYNELKEVCEPKKKGYVNLKPTYGIVTYSDSKRVVARWNKHSLKLLNVPGDIDHETLEKVPQRNSKTNLDEIPTMDEMARAIAGLKDSKAPEGDGIPAEMQKIVDAFSDAPKSFGLKIDITNTEVLYQPNSTSTREEDIIFDGKKLSSVLEFIYRGSIASSNGCIGDDTHMRMATFSVNLGRLRQRLWNNEHVPMRVKGKLYRAIELPTLLYGAEAWTVYRRQVKKLHAFMMLHLISIMLITWMDNVTNKEILEQTGLPYMEDLLIINNLGWIGHLTGLSPDRLQKQLELSCIELSCNIPTQLK
ncbi:hypothetical protein NP493_1390g00004 [Ridgeia piscesae]|uniref:Uncharacterized protein n=1 Tax=Ridgeia piscesae TaxID=27915 RepID=A0AAD9K4X2_RIDPI|nr:hypothetical protein NP493_1390g00004 [Ridgeia piscesae]